MPVLNNRTPDVHSYTSLPLWWLAACLALDRGDEVGRAAMAAIVVDCCQLLNFWHPCHWRAIPAETPIGFFQSTCYPVVQPFHRRKTGFSSFRRQLLEQSSITRYMRTVARDIPAASQDISLPPIISGPDSLTFLLPHRGPCDNFVI